MIVNGHDCKAGSAARRARNVFACAAAFVLVGALHAPSALAYYALEPVDIGLASAHVDIEKGTSRSVACSISPESERQLPGCGMLECPQGCGTLVNPRTGEKGGCQNSEGWCTCAGETYVTYNTKVVVSSSSPSVARASFSGGAVKVKGYSVGTATITIKATLSKHLDSKATFTVNVSEKAEEPAKEPDDGEASASDSPADSKEPSSSGSSTGTSKAGTGSGSSKKTGSSKASSAKSSSGKSKSGKSKSSKSGSSKSSSSKSGSSSVSKSSSKGVSVSSASSATASQPSSSAVSVAVTSSKDGQAEGDKAGKAAKDNAAATEDAEPAQASADEAQAAEPYQAAAAVSAVEAQGTQQGPGGGAVAGAVCAAAAIAAAAGFVRYRSWKRQHAPLLEDTAAGSGDDGGDDSERAGE